MNAVLQSMLAHRSIRAYQDRPVPEDILDKVIQAVQAAPNWVNLQLVSIVAVKDAARRTRFAELCNGQDHVARAPVFLVFCADYFRAHLACRRQGQDLDPVLEDIDTVIVGAHEVGIAVEAAVVAAESLGLGTVVIGDVRKHPLKVIEELSLPRYVFPVLGLCLGYAAEDPGLKPRLPREAMYFEERYDTGRQDDLLDSYDATYAAYLKVRPFNSRVGTWTELARYFYRTPYHYEHIPEMLQQQGFSIFKDTQ